MKELLDVVENTAEEGTKVDAEQFVISEGHPSSDRKVVYTNVPYSISMVRNNRSALRRAKYLKVSNSAYAD
jgi:hypothetical protein